MRVSAILWLAAPLLAAAPASAQNGFSDWESGAWEVYQDSGECWINYRPAPGHEVSVAVSKHDPDFYVAAVRPDWTWVVQAKEYQLRVQFGSFDRRTTGNGLGRPGVSTAFMGSAVANTSAFLASPSLTYTVDNKHVVRVDLNPAALAQFGACVNSLGGIGSQPRD